MSARSRLLLFRLLGSRRPFSLEPFSLEPWIIAAIYASKQAAQAPSLLGRGGSPWNKCSVSLLWACIVVMGKVRSEGRGMGGGGRWFE